MVKTKHLDDIANKYHETKDPKYKKLWYDLLKERRIRDKEVVIDLHVYGTILSAVSKKGDIAASERILADMKNAEVRPNAFIYSTLIDGAANSDASQGKNVTAALQYLNQMQCANFKPDLVTFTNVVKAYCKSGNVSAAQGFLQTMVKQSVQPGRVALGLIAFKQMSG